MKYPNISFVYNRRKSASPTVPASVEICVYHNRKQKYFATGVRVLPNQWDGQACKVVNVYNSIELNLRIETLHKQIKDYVMMLMIKNESFSFDILTAHLTSQKHSGSFREFVTSRIEERSDITESTRHSHRSLLYALEKFKRITAFEDLNLGKIEAFDSWLRGQGYRQTTIGKYHKFMKTYVNEALREGLIEKSPYLKFKVDKGKPKGRKYLDQEELDTIQNWQPDDPSVERARDLFVFQCYTGLAYADLAEFDFSKAERRGAKYVIRDTRKKSDEDFYLVLLSPALEILEKYDFKLPIISNQKYNSALKSVGVKINKSLTTHMGRHTAATMFLNMGMPVDLVSRVLGHSNTKQTLEYAKIVNKTLESAFDMIQEKIDSAYER